MQDLAWKPTDLKLARSIFERGQCRWIRNVFVGMKTALNWVQTFQLYKYFYYAIISPMTVQKDNLWKIHETMVHKLLSAAEYLPGAKRKPMNERFWTRGAGNFSDPVYRGQRFLWNNLGNWVILVFSGPKVCTRIISVTLHPFSHFLRAIKCNKLYEITSKKKF